MNLIPKTIRAQIMLAFSICFVFIAVIISVNFSNFRHLSHSMQLFELADELKSSILEMRRHEKNVFLNQQEFSFKENLAYSNQLASALERERDTVIEALGRKNYTNFVQHNRDYATLMARLRQGACDQGGCANLQEQIRDSGRNLLNLADQLVTAERRDIHRLIQQMIPLPIISLLLLVVLLGFVIYMIGKKIVRPLARITRESEAVAQGAFQRITPYGGDASNEIHRLVTAINRMVAELEKEQEQLIQSRKIASIGTLTAGIAHEINNPVNNLSLILESLIEDGINMDPAERQRLYREAMDQADRTSEIVKNLLEFSRASHPKLEELNLEEIVDKTARLVNNEMKLNNIEFHKEVIGGLSIARLDRGGLQQVLLNLFMNSIQAMENGGKLTVRIGPAEISTEARIDVIDNGPGIPPKNLSQIFDPFFTTKKEGVGTGLGLSVSYNIVKKNGGRMEVQSKPGQGTRFSIILPFSSRNVQERADGAV
ncbi:MAG: ATP-binding protein [Desulfobacteraceae bacterium]|jgi:signal transduction histidine kinase